MRRPRAPLALFLAAASLGTALACSSGDAPRLPPPDLERRNAALAELGRKLAVLAAADVSTASPLLDHTDPRVRAAAARRLAELGRACAAAVPKLAKLLAEDPDRGVRIEAALALGSSNDPGAVDPLVAGLADAERKVRLYAFKGLRRLGDAGIAGLIAHLPESSPLSSLQYEDEAGKEIPLTDEIKARLVLVGAPAVPQLAAAVGSDEPVVRSAVMGVLGQIGPDAAGAIPRLVFALDQQEDASLAAQAASALARIGDLDPTVIPALTRASESENRRVADAARRALGNLRNAAKKNRGTSQRPGFRPIGPAPEAASPAGQ